MPNYYFIARFKPKIYSCFAEKLKLKIHLTKSPNRDHIYKLCLYTLEKFMLKNNTPHYTSQNHLSVTILKHFVYG